MSEPPRPDDEPFLRRGDYLWYAFVLASMLIAVLVLGRSTAVLAVCVAVVALLVAVDLRGRSKARRRAEASAGLLAHRASRQARDHP